MRVPGARGLHAPVSLALLGFAVPMIAALIYALQTGTRLSVRHTPLIDAAMEIKLEATTAHLWFEEVLSGDPHETMADVWRHLDEADWYARAMLEGGSNAEGTFIPLDEPEMRQQIRGVRGSLEDFREITRERWETRQISAAGTEIDQRYDDVFETFVRLADDVETAVQASVARDLRLFRRTLFALIAGAVLLSVLVGAVILRYLAERDRAELEATEVRSRLTHVTRVGTVGEMATGIAHEINQPLAAIAAAAQACRRLIEQGRAEEGMLRDTLEDISNQSLRAGEVIRHLRSLVSKGESVRSPADVNELIRDAAVLGEVDARAHGIRTRLALASELPRARVDGIQIQQVILNLLRNGVEAMEETRRGGEIRIDSRLGPDEAVEISVADQGPGLSDEAAAHLFDPFFTTKDTGLGMGLSICESIVESHGGRIWHSRNAAHGTTVHFSLPLTGRPRSATD